MTSDRPLHRKAIKLAFQIFAGRAHAHAQGTWPHLQLQRDDTGAGGILYRGRRVAGLLPAKLPQNLAEITIIGSGPSLATQDVTRLAPRSAILLNGAMTLAERLPPLAIAIEDERFVWRHREMIRHAPADCLWLLSPSVIRALLENDPAALAERCVILIDSLLKPTHAARRRVDDPAIAGFVQRGAGGAGLSLDPGRGVMPAGTVAFTAMQFALAARPGRIGLAGIDLANAAMPRFYESAGNSAASGIVTGLDRILKNFAVARDLAVTQGIELACYSPVSALLKIGYPYSDRLEHR